MGERHIYIYIKVKIEYIYIVLIINCIFDDDSENGDRDIKNETRY